MANRATEAHFYSGQFDHLTEMHGSITMMLMLILTVVLMIALVGSLLIWPHSKKWGYSPIGAIGLIILIALIVALNRR